MPPPRQFDNLGWTRPDQALDVAGPGLERRLPLAEELVSVINFGDAADPAGAVVEGSIDQMRLDRECRHPRMLRRDEVP
jgi:hypothetical protein